MASHDGYRDSAQRRVPLRWRGDETAALELLYGEREWKLNVGAALVACLVVLAGGFFVERLTELLAIAIGTLSLAPLGVLLWYAINTHERRVIRVEGVLERGPFGGFRIRSGARTFRLVPARFRDQIHVPGPVVAKVHPGFDAVIPWAPR